MPYQRNQDLPKKLRRILPAEGAQSIFRNAFNASMARGKPESVAFAGAYAAVENGGYTRSTDGIYRKRWEIDRDECERLKSYAASTRSQITAFVEQIDQVVHLTAASVLKIDEDQRLVFGWFSVIEEDGEQVVDSQGDVIFEADLEKTVYKFNLDCRAGGVMHKRSDGVPVVIGQLVESVFFSKEKQEVLGVDLGKIGWWGGFFVEDEECWQDVKAGKLPAFSISGRGHRSTISV